jgi:hypothetical protein
MKKLEVIKAIAEIVVSVGVGAIVGNAVNSTTPGDIGKIRKACVVVGSFVLSSMVTDKAVKYTGKAIDDFATKFSSTTVNVEV